MRTLPRGRGSITKSGYRRIRQNRRQKFEHVLVWEAHQGPVPPGMEIHHINGDKLDNRIENLRLVTRLVHKRTHSGCGFHDGVWWKECRKCGVWKPVTDFYEYPGRSGVMGPCRICCSRLAVDYKRKRRQRLLVASMAMLMPSPPPGGMTESTPAAAMAGVNGGAN